MQPLFTRDESRDVDRAAMKELGVAGLVLMENAGRGATQAVCEVFGDCLGRVVLLGGPGQNGGDAWVMARRLALQGHRPLAVLVGDGSRLRGDAQSNWALLGKLGVETIELSPEHAGAIGAHLRSATLVVDGLFGTGTKNAVIAFQQHRGLTQDGVVGPTTLKHLLWHYERVKDTSTTCRTYPAWYEREEWGHGTTVAAVMKAAYYLKAYWPRVELPIWDLSYEHGGRLGHQSHQRGMDMDIGVITTNNGHCSGRSANRWSSNYSWTATSRLVTDLRKGADWNTDGMISLIYFNDTRVKNDQPSNLIRSYSGHDDHLHARYCARSQGPVHSSSEETKWSGGNCT